MRVQSHCGPILIVDDDVVFRTTLAATLHRTGYATVESSLSVARSLIVAPMITD
jgi:ActR/RegA family two-component response regulator